MTYSTSPTLDGLTPIAEIKRRTASVSEALAEIQAMGPWPVPVESFNDDDLYVYKVSSKQLIRSFSSKDPQVIEAAQLGFRVKAGQTWAKGMAAKSLGLWRQS